MEIKKHEELYRLISKQIPPAIRGECLIKLTYLRECKKYSMIGDRLMLIKDTADMDVIRESAMEIAIELARLVCDDIMVKVRSYRLEV